MFRYSRDPNPNHDTLKPYLLGNSEGDHGICSDFFEEAVSRINEDEMVLPMFTSAMVQISQELSKMNMNQDYKPYINVRASIANVQPAAVPKLLTYLTGARYLFPVPKTTSRSRR